jgi:hypothetical protein
MYLSDAIDAMEMNLRSTCMMLEAVRNNQVGKAVDIDWLPMQDHLSQCVPTITIHQDSTVKDCLKYLEQLYKGLTEAMEHYEKGNDVVGANNPEVAEFVDMLIGYIGHSYPGNYVDCARECIRAYELTPIDPDEEKNDENFTKWKHTVLNKFNEILKKHKIDITNKGEWTIRVGYLEEWLGRKYWKE